MMSTTTMSRTRRHTPKTVRIVARVTPEIKEKIEQAASLEHTSVTTFIERNAVQAAEEIIRRHGVIPLSERASAALIESFFNPREPGAALERARQRHVALIASSEE
jgi:uncharacterized protein (DUF1778 family)